MIRGDPQARTVIGTDCELRLIRGGIILIPNLPLDSIVSSVGVTQGVRLHYSALRQGHPGKPRIILLVSI